MIKMFRLSLLFLILFLFVQCSEKTAAPDTTPPQIEIISPLTGTVVRDSVTIKALIAENDAIDAVEFYIDGNLFATLREEPFQIVWHTQNFDFGKHSILCKAIDKAGNEAISNIIHLIKSDVMFKAVFKNNYIAEDREVVFFISDTNGVVLSDTTFSGNT